MILIITLMVCDFVPMLTMIHPFFDDMYGFSLNYYFYQCLMIRGAYWIYFISIIYIWLNIFYIKIDFWWFSCLLNIFFMLYDSLTTLRKLILIILMLIEYLLSFDNALAYITLIFGFMHSILLLMTKRRRGIGIPKLFLSLSC